MTVECLCCGLVKPRSDFPIHRRQCRRCLSLKRQLRRANQNQTSNRRRLEGLLLDISRGRKSLLKSDIINALVDEFGGVQGTVRAIKDTHDRAVAAGRVDIVHNVLNAILETIKSAQAIQS